MLAESAVPMGEMSLHLCNWQTGLALGRWLEDYGFKWGPNMFGVLLRAGSSQPWASKIELQTPTKVAPWFQKNRLVSRCFLYPKPQPVFQNLLVCRDCINHKVLAGYVAQPRHAFAHFVVDLQFSDENCRAHKTLSEETMLGKITRLSSQCPGSNVLERFFQRFNLFLAFHWENIMASDDDIAEADWGPRHQYVSMDTENRKKFQQSYRGNGQHQNHITNSMGWPKWWWMISQIVSSDHCMFLGFPMVISMILGFTFLVSALAPGS